MFPLYRRALVIAGFILCLCPSVFAYSGGTGESNNPYQIGTVSDWNDLMNTTTDWDKNFIMTADVNLQGIPLTPVGNSTNKFIGTFDGNSHIIRNMDINNPLGNDIGLFGYVHPSGQICNLGIEGVNVIGNERVGSLSGRNYGDITRCYNKGKVVGSSSVGGLVGYNDGSIIGSYSIGAVDGNVYVGGLVGTNYSGDITNSYSMIEVNGYHWVGGLVGRCCYAFINNCYSAGVVNAEIVAGGLVGYNENGSITNCYSTSAVDSNGGAGGLVSTNQGHIENCYSTGAVSGNIYGIGGLVGKNSWLGDITKCYSTGVVSGDGDVGGLVGRNMEGFITISFWDVETSGLTISRGGSGLITEDMKKESTYSLQDWSGDDWTIDDGNDYPHLAWENTVGQPIAEPNIPLNGCGTEECPYEIANAQDLQLLSNVVFLWDKHLILVNDIDLTGFNIEPIGCDIIQEYIGYGVDIVIYYGLENQFQGVLDGNGHVISNLHIEVNDMDYVGLFRYLGPNAIVKNLGIEGANIVGHSYVGSLAGINNGNINNCYSTGVVSSNGSYVGGLVGLNYYDGSISYSYNTAGVSGEESQVGGLVGYNNYGNIKSCYNAGIIRGDYYDVGGLVGYNNGDILNCYNMGEVSGSYCYVGGLIGENISDKKVECCYNTGTVSGSSCVGGLAGGNGSCITNCYNTGAVGGDSYVGGLVGVNYVWAGVSYVYISPGSITNCYSTGAVGGGDYVGGLAGENWFGSTIDKSFWDVNSSGTPDGVGILYPEPNGVMIGLTTDQMQDINTYLNAGWDFSYTDGDEAEWFIQIDEYPILTWQISPADIYTDGKNNLKDFAVFAQYWMRDDCAIYNYYCQWADLDFNGSVDIDDLIELMNYWLQEGIYN